MDFIRRAEHAAWRINMGSFVGLRRNRTRAMGTVMSLSLLLAIPLSLRAQVSFAEFPTDVPGGTPEGIAVGSDGALWFADYGADAIGRIDAFGKVTEYSLETATSICQPTTT